jgi:hypothetical protein
MPTKPDQAGPSPLTEEQAEAIGGGRVVPEEIIFTTQAEGEEDRPVTTLAVGEEEPVVTTLAVGEEDPCG